MEQYISKSALVTKIEKLKERFVSRHHKNGIDWPLDNYGKMMAYNEILSFLDTLEVKEVDLNEEIEKCLKRHSMLAVGKKDFTDIAKHFFELGMQVSNKAQKGEEV